MPNEVKRRKGILTDFTLDPASLADGAVKQSAIIDPEENFQFYKIFCQATLGTSPSQGNIPVHLIEGDSADSGKIITDGAGDSEGLITIVGAPIIGVMPTKDSPSTNDVLEQVFTIRAPAEAWGIAIGNDTGVALKNDGHKFRYRGWNPDVLDS